MINSMFIEIHTRNIYIVPLERRYMFSLIKFLNEQKKDEMK